MKFCPTCQTRYDEEILRFCTKDGTPLLDEKTPNFIQMPSESLPTPDEDFGEETVIRRNPAATPIPTPLPEFEEESSYQSPRNSAERIIIPTADQQVRSRVTPPYQPPPQKSNTAKVVALTLLGTLAVLAGAGGVMWFLQNDTASNKNANTNVNTNQSVIDINANTNLNVGNFDFNANANTNTNTTNINAAVNLKTPTPTPKPSPSPTPTPSPTPNANANGSTDTTNTNRPANTNQTTTTPSPRPNNTNTTPTNRPVNAGVLNSRAVNLTTPAYPSAARSARASGRVTVEITVDESGLVTSARAISGHPLLRQSAEAAARQSRFDPVRIAGQPTKATGTLIYNFVNN
jgi:TonB family protein